MKSQPQFFVLPGGSHTTILKAIVFVHVVSRSHPFLLPLKRRGAGCCFAFADRKYTNSYLLPLCLYFYNVKGVFLISIKAAGEVQSLHDHFISLVAEM